VETSLCSVGSDFRALGRRFVCVRLYYTLEGASEPFARFGLGPPKGPRNNVDPAFLTPDGRNFNVRTLKPAGAPAEDGVWVRDIVASNKNEAGDGKEIVEKTIEIMRILSQQYPPKREGPAVPWQVSLAHALFVSAWDGKLAGREHLERKYPRRILLAPAPEGRVDPDLARLLGDPDLLRRCEPRYVFVRIDPAAAPPEALRAAGPGGLAVLDFARTADGFSQAQADSKAARSYPRHLESRAGPFAKASGIDWIAANFAAASNPNRSDWYFYYLYAVERAGVFTNLRSFGPHDWYKEGANHLLGLQKTDGSWHQQAQESSGPVPDTCWAILFLRRRTPPLQDVASVDRFHRREGEK
jgi:hypothetical protein